MKADENQFPISMFNTLSRQKERVIPLPGKPLRFFVCGPTVYDHSHLGHAKTYIQFDFIVTYLRYRSYKVFYLQNITDIDDKIIERARRDGIPWEKISRRNEALFLEDMVSLENTSVDTFARATDHIPSIVRQIQTLLDKGFAYRASDGIYFNLAAYPLYGQLSGRTQLCDEDAVSRIDDSVSKKNKGDFCLWKNAKSGEPSWETEIGEGRPGWHIEDTAITETYLGQQYDIHGGAVDLIFPHHEAEIALMESISNKAPFVRYWVHTGFLNTRSQKMSKSKGNFTTIREAIATYDYRVIRFAFLRHHYRSSVDFTADFFSQAESALRRLHVFQLSLHDVPSSLEEVLAVEQALDAIYGALDDDFNTPKAFAILFDYVRSRNSLGLATQSSMHLLSNFNSIFKIFGFDSESTGGHDPSVEQLVILRETLRSQKRFTEADKVRDRLIALGVQLRDSRIA